MSIIDNFFIKSRVFCFISNIFKLQQLHYNNFCQNFNWFFEKIKKSFYLGKSRKRKTARKSRKIFHLSDCCKQPHPPTPSPNREGENIPLCQERVPEGRVRLWKEFRGRFVHQKRKNGSREPKNFSFVRLRWNY